jgi:hypothetical protein
MTSDGSLAAKDRRSVPERVCVVCLEGEYVVRSQEDFHQSDAPRSNWHIEACTNCGHVQFFRRDWRRHD